MKVACMGDFNVYLEGSSNQVYISKKIKVSCNTWIIHWCTFEHALSGEICFSELNLLFQNIYMCKRYNPLYLCKFSLKQDSVLHLGQNKNKIIALESLLLNECILFCRGRTSYLISMKIYGNIWTPNIYTSNCLAFLHIVP